jgi:LysR family transcriptional regulator of beta-lactamase
MLDSSIALADMAAEGYGIALLPPALFGHWTDRGRLVTLFDHSIVAGAYWLTRLQSRPETSGMRSFREWLCRAVADQPPATG